MEWLVVVVFLVFMGGLVVVTTDAVKHADKSSHNTPLQPTIYGRVVASFSEREASTHGGTIQFSTENHRYPDMSR